MALLVQCSSTFLQGTWTPLHADVLRSYSWSTNVTGRKRWKLLPPQYTHLLYDRFGRYTAASLLPHCCLTAPPAAVACSSQPVCLLL